MLGAGIGDSGSVFTMHAAGVDRLEIALKTVSSARLSARIVAPNKQWQE